MSQPEWELIANLGGVDLLADDSYFVYRDRTGVYAPEAEFVRPQVSEDGELKGESLVYRIVLEPHTFVDGVLSDNSYHPDYPAWYAARDDEHRRRHGYDQWLKFCRIAASNAMDASELASWFCSDDPIYRAMAYREIASYHGWHELDDQPLRLSSDEIESRYRPRLAELEARP